MKTFFYNWIFLFSFLSTFNIIEVNTDNKLCPNESVYVKLTHKLIPSINKNDSLVISANNDTIQVGCGGILFQASLINNDIIMPNALFDIVADAQFGRVTITRNGAFSYSPITPICGTDQFSYEICIDDNSKICDTAMVFLTFADTIAPTPINIPANIRIGIDDEIFPSPLVTVSDNCPNVSIDLEEISTQGESGCAQDNYSITRTWTARDVCNNISQETQTIEVVDEVAPNIFRIHTLPNGKRIVAGVAEFTSEHWKTVHFPIDFVEKPIVFTQLQTANEATPAITRLRNVSATNFEVKIQEEAANDNIHKKESVAWIAIEQGSQTETYQWQADTIAVNHGWTNIPFAQIFEHRPLFFSNMQTIFDEEAATIRNSSISVNNAKIRLQEENSVDLSAVHSAELTGYLAIEEIGNLTNATGEKIGEVGIKAINSEWTTIKLNSHYYNPVVITSSLSFEDINPATIRIKDVSADSFDIRIEEWEYLEHIHGTETISYMVVEGCLPLVLDACELITANGNHYLDSLIAIDNTGEIMELSYEETFDTLGNNLLINRHWFSIDHCGNEKRLTQETNCQGVLLKAKAFLQGALIGNRDGLMRDDLRRLEHFPLSEPYSQMEAYQDFDFGAIKMKESLLEIEDKDAIVDWVFLELRSDVDICKVLARSVALLQRDGDVIAPNGDSLILFTGVTAGNYYISINHRNHIDMLTQETNPFSVNSIPFIDFTKASTTINNPPVSLLNKSLGLWAGDLNQDNSVIFQGPNNDIFFIFLHVILDPTNTRLITNFISRGYANADLNMDGKVIFQGPNNEGSELLFWTTLAYPLNEEGRYVNFVLKSDVCED